MGDVTKINPMAKKHSDKVKLCFDNLKDVELPNSGNEFFVFIELFDALEKGELSQELFDKFKQIENSSSCWRKLKETLIVAEYRGREKSI